MSTDKNSEIDPLMCPLCGQSNACLNLGAADVERNCWCNEPVLEFPEDLLAQIPPAQRRKACICRACVQKYHAYLAASVDKT